MRAKVATRVVTDFASRSSVKLTVGCRVPEESSAGYKGWAPSCHSWGVVLVRFWYGLGMGFGMVSVWFRYGFGIVTV